MMGCSDYDLKFFQFATIAWALWTNRNKMAIEKKFLLQQLISCINLIYYCKTGGRGAVA